MTGISYAAATLALPIEARTAVDDFPVPKAWPREIVEAVFTITIYIAVSKFGDALGVELEEVFSGIKPVLEVAH